MSISNPCINIRSLVRTLVLVVWGLFLSESGQGAEMVHLWSFDGDLMDTSGSDNHGEAFGDISFTDGRFGEALVLDEVDDLVENDDASNLPLDPEAMWSMNVWYNLEAFPSLAYGGGYGGRDDDGRVRSFLSFGPGGDNEDNAFYYWGSNIDVYAGEDYDTDGQWHMYTITFDGELLRMYEDSQLVIDTDIDKQGESIADEFFGRGELEPIVSVGGPSNWDANLLGAVDEFSIWSGALSDTEIADLFSPVVEDPLAPLNDGTLTGLAERNDYVHDVLGTWVGDSTLDGEFNTTDLVAVLTEGEYEDGVAGNSSWITGDWTGDHEFDSSDFVAALADGGYELGPRAVAAVPEPSSILLVLIGSIMGLRQLSKNDGIRTNDRK